MWCHHAGDPIDVHVILQHPDDEELLEVDPAEDPSTLPLEKEPRSHPGPPPSGKQYDSYKCVTVGQTGMGEGDDSPIRLQYTVPRLAIFGSTLSKRHRTAGYTLVSCVVAPGFSFDDFEVFTKKQLMEICPQHQQIIDELAYEELPF